MTMSEKSQPVCLCLTGQTIEEDLAAVEHYRNEIDLVELRADCLSANEKFYIRSFPEKAGLPCILTVRRKCDGGEFEDGEGVRLVLLAKALSYARQDTKANFAYVDLEDDFHISTIEEACRTFGTRIIRSSYFIHGMPDDLESIWEKLTQEDDEIPKLTMVPRHSEDLVSLVRWAATLPAREKLIIAVGEFGHPTRVLGRRLGSMFTYTSALKFGLPAAAPGHIDPETFISTFRGKDTDEKSDIYALLGGKGITASLSPHLHNSAFRDRDIDAVFANFPSDNIGSALRVLDLLGVKGAAITAPFKEDILPYLETRSVDVRKIGACNTIVRTSGERRGKEARHRSEGWNASVDGVEGWAGFNTDADGFERSALEFLGRDTLKGMKATLVGAGGAAKSVALALYRMGAECLIVNRTITVVRELARKYDFSWGPLDDRAIDAIAEHSDLIVQATSVGMTGGPQGDPLSFYEFNGEEAVFDLIYKPEKSPLLARAEAAGCKIINGYKMLCYQAAGQYRIWMGEEPPESYYKATQPEGEVKSVRRQNG
jgi:3-dehydroquinate dehydratase/shikimate dehydrogenase